MRGVILHAPHDVRVETREDPRILHPSDVLLELAATCVCGSDLWDYRGDNEIPEPKPMGHEYCGVIVEAGSEVRTLRAGDFVVGSFAASDNTCVICRAGYHTGCLHKEYVGQGGAQSTMLRVPLADGTLVATPEHPPAEMIPSLLAASDVLGTGWFAAWAAGVTPGSTVAVIGDGAVGLLGVLAAKRMGAERIIAMSRHPARRALAVTFGATDLVEERGDDGVAVVRDLTAGVGVDAAIEAVGTQEAMMQAIRSTRAGGGVGYVGLSHGVELPGRDVFRALVRLHGGPAPVRRFLPDLIRDIWAGAIDPGAVFDMTVPLERASEAYRAMEERRAVKAMLTF